ncbi:MAG: hypothetical protein N3D82_01300 [Ignisphaera sp.]|nr:hypothetical protein [Ignisphaera sp.]MCX8167653.1 hypothetical protein [Ignisphaera sp.]MDW8085643.1 hypothetical protein [Ignisphaera sp.]
MANIPPAALDELKQRIRRYIRAVVPGYLELLNIYSMRIYGKDVLDLFFNSPSSVYDILTQHYGDSFTVDFAISRLFLRPISLEVNNVLLEEQLLELIKKRRDSEVIKIIADSFTCSQP